MTQDERERWLIDAARDYNQPPDTPRDEMWTVVGEALRGADEESDRVAPLRPRRPRPPRAPLGGGRWVPWGLGLAAATLVVGFGLGRITRPAPQPVPGYAESAPADADARETSLPVRLAANSHLGEAEALLTLFRTGGAPEDRAATARWARELLSTTRLLMDSRAGGEPEMARLLADLELVLVQIANVAADPAGQEMIEEGIAERQLLAKLRAVTVPTEVAL